MIKKNGGIFGRNPTYNDVVVEGVLTLKEAQVFDNDITINGDLTVNGTETVINTVELNVDDKNITMGAVVAKVGLAATTNITAGQFTVQLADTSGLIPGMTVTKTAGTGAFGASPKIASVDSHMQITLTVAHATSGTIIFDTGGATDDTADGGGITLKGTTDKFIKWVKASVAWVFSDPIKAPDVTVDNLTASKPVFTDANKKLTSTGTLAIDQGGTGKTTQQDAINALAGAVTAARFLRGDGTNVTLSAIQASDVPTLNQNTTGTAAGLSATLATTSGGTGLTSFTSGGLLYAFSTSALATSDRFTFNGTNLSVGTAANGVLSSFSNPTNHAIRVYGASTWSGSMAFRYVDTGSQSTSYAYVSVGDSGANRVFSLQPDGGNVAIGATAAAELLTLGAGNLKLNNGNLVIGTSGKGIDFSATPGTGTSELFADYEEGNWTPYMNADVGGQFPGSTSGSGKYVKIGNHVYCTGTVTWTSAPSGANGATRIYGLPYTTAESTNALTPWTLVGNSTWCNNMYSNGGTTHLILYLNQTITNGSWVPASGTLILTFFYRV